MKYNGGCVLPFKGKLKRAAAGGTCASGPKWQMFAGFNAESLKFRGRDLDVNTALDHGQRGAGGLQTTSDFSAAWHRQDSAIETSLLTVVASADRRRVLGVLAHSAGPAAVVSVASASGVRTFGRVTVGSEAYWLQTAAAPGQELTPSHSGGTAGVAVALSPAAALKVRVGPYAREFMAAVTQHSAEGGTQWSMYVSRAPELPAPLVVGLGCASEGTQLHLQASPDTAQAGAYVEVRWGHANKATAALTVRPRGTYADVALAAGWVWHSA